MKTQNLHKRFLGILVATILSTGATTMLMAAGTASGTSISNTASIDYKVATVDQPTITSAAYAFLVDNKVDLTVSTVDVATVKVTPGTNTSYMTFTVTNTGNTVQDFALSAAALDGVAGAFATTDNVDANSTAIFVETAGGAGYILADDTDTYIDELAADANITVYMVGNFALGFTDADIASYYLVAEARVGGSAGGGVGAALTETAGADTFNAVDIVFADGDGDLNEAGTGDAARDAKHSSLNDYEIATASLSIGKDSEVIWDPFNLAVDPKRIPGAIVEYTITISNGGGSQTATDIAVTDSLNTEITAGTITFNTQYDATANQGIVVTAPNLYSGNPTELTNVGGDDEGEWNSGTNVVTVTGITVTAGQTATVKFKVTIQ
jgi:hypothetical protein